MTDYEILKCIDSGAVFYLDVFGNAEHMEIKDNSNYRFIRPKDGGQGVRLIYNKDREHEILGAAEHRVDEELESVARVFDLTLTTLIHKVSY